MVKSVSFLETDPTKDKRKSKMGEGLASLSLGACCAALRYALD
jgi:hypothetical protein